MTQLHERTTVSAHPFAAQLSVFPTELGWFALVGADDRLTLITIGHDSERDARKAAQRKMQARLAFDQHDWSPSFRERLQDYARGVEVDFVDLKIDFPDRTRFQRSVIAATRRIPWGATRTYGQLAQSAGSPRAARAVGSVMAANRFPIIVPCHRVVGAGGRLGGFSAPQGVTLKQRMLELEGVWQRSR